MCINRLGIDNTASLQNFLILLGIPHIRISSEVSKPEVCQWKMNNIHWRKKPIIVVFQTAEIEIQAYKVTCITGKSIETYNSSNHGTQPIYVAMFAVCWKNRNKDRQQKISEKPQTNGCDGSYGYGRGR